MGEPSENAALALESLLGGTSEKPDVQEFHRRAPCEATVAPPGQPDGAHSSLADRRLQRVGTDGLPNQRRGSGPDGRVHLQESLGTQRVVFLEQRLQLLG